MISRPVSKDNFDLRNDKSLNFSILVLIIVLLGGFATIILNSQDTKSHVTTTPSALKKNDFVWGTFSNAYFGNGPGEEFAKEHTDMQIPYFKDLGINTVKFNLLFNLPNEFPFREENDYYVDKLIENHIDRYMVIEHGVDDDFFETANYQVGYEWGKKVATHFSGRINYYQMLNEVSGTAMKPTFPGFNKNDYDEHKYQVIKEYLRGMSDAIHEFDPGAQKVITAHFLGTAMIDRLMEDGVKFEVIGWDWYSEMGNSLTNKEYAGQVFNIPEHFRYSGKKFWVSELSLAHGSFGGREVEQSEFLKTVIKDAISSKLVSGVFTFTMFDMTAAFGGVADQNNSWGLVTNKFNPISKQWEFADKKPAYYMYQEMIRSHLSI
jgi:hypothetical protein